MSVTSAARLRRIETQLAGRGVVPTTLPGDPVAFAALLGYELDTWQATALCSRASRAIWLCARQTGKTLTAALAALYQSLSVSRSLVLVISPTARQSSILYRTLRDMLERIPDDPAVRGMIEDTAASCTFGNGSRVVSLPGDRAETVRGWSGPSLVIEDESAFVSDATHHAIRPTVAASGGRLLLLSSPFGRRGHLYELWESGGDDWERVRVRADECPRIPAAFLAQERRSLPALVYQSEYEAIFTESVDSVFAHEHVMQALSNDITPLFGAIHAA